MDVTSKGEAPTHSHGESLVSHVLHAKQDAPGTDLTVTWVELDPNSAQRAHSHDPEQVYVVVDGQGVMVVGGEKRSVQAGDLVRVPPNTEHRLRNTGNRTLEFISAATPAVSAETIETFYEQTDERS